MARVLQQLQLHMQPLWQRDGQHQPSGVDSLALPMAGGVFSVGGSGGRQSGHYKWLAKRDPRSILLNGGAAAAAAAAAAATGGHVQ
jgi:hypothetical protein